MLVVAALVVPHTHVGALGRVVVLDVHTLLWVTQVDHAVLEEGEALVGVVLVEGVHDQVTGWSGANRINQMKDQTKSTDVISTGEKSIIQSFNISLCFAYEYQSQL